MKTIFLAAGRSTRMDPIGDKNFLEFCGEPLIVKLLKNAAAGGLENFIVVAGKHNAGEIASVLQKFKFPATIVEQPNPDDGMAGGVLAGLEKCGAGEVFLLGGNDAVDPKIYEKMVFEGRSADGAILAKKVEKYFPGGYLQTDRKKITTIVEKPGAGNEPSNLVNIVAHFFRDANELQKLLKQQNFQNPDAYERALHELFQQKNFTAVEYSGNWCAVKFPHHVLEMMEFWLEKLPENFVDESAEVADTARLRGEKIYISAGAKITDNVVISGPCFVGKNAIIGTGSLVRGSIIGENCVVGFNSEIARSFLAKKVSTHIAYVGDSIVDENVNFGAFSCTTNLRLDHKNVKVKIKDEVLDSGREKLGAIVGAGTQIGSGAKIMPGRTISNSGFVAPGEVFK
ncbi:NTP transferase domain-containing protein [bacterium]|jgi:UDP-N-acetylglucosamine diphosphorylase / glucose-1-phosphate thymidylyltransferase / UDP-N-acetylgalactosamine diphosphorylase / glucosamine-1-phosphate N-acetyltransferase / galactosamine-1-phosphate N-acetyltransferase|nr:NTP transferase domain-containing protein [bacterium]MBT6831756.1 NTP transferase domain-containing protein [bacterium]MBT6996579.1 NTP transferase domain-containing protein [bacterium]MBT7772905.1 NTP transferase domain-containing protein [bacterium]